MNTAHQLQQEARLRPDHRRCCSAPCIPTPTGSTDEKKSRDLGEAAIGQIDTGSFMMKLFLLGGFRGIVADYLWNRAEEYKREHDWDRWRDRRPDHQAPAPLPVDLDLPGLEPGLQRLGRVGRPRGQVPVDQEGDPVRPGGRQEEPAVARPGLGHRLVLLPQARLLRRVDHPPPALPRRRGRGLQDLLRPRARSRTSSATTTSSSATAGSAGRSRWWTAGEPRLVRRHGREHPSTSTPSPQRKGRPDDIAFRSMPAHAQTRYAAGLEKMSMYGIAARFGEVAKNEWASALNEWVKFGEHVFMSAQRGPRRGRQAASRPGPDRRCHQPGAVQDSSPRTSDTGPSAGPTR